MIKLRRVGLAVFATSAAGVICMYSLNPRVFEKEWRRRVGPPKPRAIPECARPRISTENWSSREIGPVRLRLPRGFAPDERAGKFKANSWISKSGSIGAVHFEKSVKRDLDLEEADYKCRAMIGGEPVLIAIKDDRGSYFVTSRFLESKVLIDGVGISNDHRAVVIAAIFTAKAKPRERTGT